MDYSSSTDIAHDFPFFFRVYTDGRVERSPNHRPPVPPSADSPAVLSRDVVISADVSARLFLPKPAAAGSSKKLPLLVYFHGGGFCIESAFSETYHYYLSSLVAAADVVAVSVEYRLAPENPIPACYEDSWEALKWVGRHARPEPGPGFAADLWLKGHADFTRVFLAGDSAGANIAHTMAVRAGSEPLGSGFEIAGMALIHPYFGSGSLEKERLWTYICPGCTADDPKLDPAADPGLFGKMPCRNVLVCTSAKDFLRDRGWRYYEALKESGWGGEAKLVEYEDEGHVFHLMNPSCEKAVKLMELMKSFLNLK